MKRLTTFGLIACMLGGIAWSQAPPGPPPAPGPPTVVESLTIDGPFWRLVGASGAAYNISGPPGTYAVPGLATGGAAPAPVLITVTIPQASIQSPPGGPPNKPPQPSPQTETEVIWAVGVFDTKTLDKLQPGQLAVWTSTTLESNLNNQKIRWRHYNVSEAAGTTWGKEAEKTGYPALVIVDAKGKVLLAQPIKDESGVMAAIKTVR